jgi:hypothetical protein
MSMGLYEMSKDCQKSTWQTGQYCSCLKIDAAGGRGDQKAEVRSSNRLWENLDYTQHTFEF